MRDDGDVLLLHAIWVISLLHIKIRELLSINAELIVSTLFVSLFFKFKATTNLKDRESSLFFYQLMFVPSAIRLTNFIYFIFEKTPYSGQIYSVVVLYIPAIIVSGNIAST